MVSSAWFRTTEEFLENSFAAAENVPQNNYPADTENIYLKQIAFLMSAYLTNAHFVEALLCQNHEL